MEKNIKGKVVVITGASSGIGEAAAKHLSELGATVVLGARRANRIEKLAKEINDNGGKALAIAVDVMQRDQAQLPDFFGALLPYHFGHTYKNHRALWPLIFITLKILYETLYLLEYYKTK
jgi:NAD(P)-dependent dehydrogenase (short-subunit alcohol dehydrogenase family)